MTALSIRSGGAWNLLPTTSGVVHIRDADTWKVAKNIWIMASGTWYPMTSYDPPPSVPQNFQVTSSNNSFTSTTLSWTAPAVSDAPTYTITQQRCNSAGSPTGSPSAVSTSGTSYTWSNVERTKYAYRVWAVNSNSVASPTATLGYFTGHADVQSLRDAYGWVAQAAQVVSTAAGWGYFAGSVYNDDVANYGGSGVMDGVYNANHWASKKVFTLTGQFSGVEATTHQWLQIFVAIFPNAIINDAQPWRLNNIALWYFYNTSFGNSDQEVHVYLQSLTGYIPGPLGIDDRAVIWRGPGGSTMNGGLTTNSAYTGLTAGRWGAARLLNGGGYINTPGVVVGGGNPGSRIVFAIGQDMGYEEDGGALFSTTAASIRHLSFAMDRYQVVGQEYYVSDPQVLNTSFTPI